MADPFNVDYKTALDDFWRHCCAKEGLQIEVGETRRDCFDRTFWQLVKHPSISKTPKPAQPLGYELQTRFVVRTILYYEEGLSIGGYFYTEVIEKVTKFAPEVIPL